MTGQYVKFLGSESNYGQKRLLRGELEILNFVKRIRAYKSLRRDDIALRLTLKTKISEILAEMEILDKSLPYVKFMHAEKPTEKDKEKEKKEDEVLTLDREVELIRRKLERLEING